jgi:hypothetical protein
MAKEVENQKPEPTAAEQLQLALTQANEKLQEQVTKTQQMGQLLANPDVRKTLELIGQGKPVKFMEEEVKPPPSMKDLMGTGKEDENVDLNTLDNKALVNLIGDTFEQMIEARKGEATEAVTVQLRGMDSKLKTTQDTLISLIAKQNLQHTMSKYKDFDAYKEDIAQVLNTYPNLDMVDAYKLAKSSKLLKAHPTNETISEKPESSQTFPIWSPTHMNVGNETKESGETKQVLRMSGSRSFRNTLMDNIAKRKVGQQ